MMHKDINHSQQIPSCGEFIKEDGIKEDMKEVENVDDPSSTHYFTETYLNKLINRTTFAIFFLSLYMYTDNF